MSNQVDYILNNFNFKKVKKVMDDLKWTWFMEKGFMVPEISDLKETAKKLLDEAYYSKEDYWVATGGFTVEKTGEELSLYFVIERSSKDLE